MQTHQQHAHHEPLQRAIVAENRLNRQIHLPNRLMHDLHQIPVIRAVHSDQKSEFGIGRAKGFGTYRTSDFCALLARLTRPYSSHAKSF
jgi:hypothetical protein